MEKLQAIKDNDEDGNGLIESENIVRNNDRSSMHIVVNEEESYNRDEFDVTLASGSDSEAKE